MTSLRERIAAFLRLTSDASAPAVRVVDERGEDGYTRSLVRFVAPDGDDIEAYLFRPAGQALTAGVLALHQHNSQWTIGKSEIAGLTGDPLHAFGPALARRGVTVFAPDALGFESRLTPSISRPYFGPALSKSHSTPDGWTQYYNQMAHRLVRGDLLMTKLLSDCATAVTVLQGFCGTGSPGVVGHSFGGIEALFLAALDTRVAFACSSGAACSFRYKLAHGIGLEMSLIIPGLALQFDVDDLIRCVAPRRLLVVSADDDPASADAEDLVQAARPAFETADGAGHLRHLRARGTHALDRARSDAIVAWMLEQAARADTPSAHRQL